MRPDHGQSHSCSSSHDPCRCNSSLNAPFAQVKWPYTSWSTRSSDPWQERLNFIPIQERELLNIRRPLLPRQQPQSLERVEEKRLPARDGYLTHGRI